MTIIRSDQTLCPARGANEHVVPVRVDLDELPQTGAIEARFPHSGSKQRDDHFRVTSE